MGFCDYPRWDVDLDTYNCFAAVDLHFSAMLQFLRKRSEQTKPAEDDESNGTIPQWITKNFCQKQYTLLKLLWGKGKVAEKELLNAVKKQGGADPSGALRKLVSRAEAKMTEIGSLWEIREMTREGVKYLYLDDMSGQK